MKDNMLIKNPHAWFGEYPASLQSMLNIENTELAKRYLSHWSFMAEEMTPIWSMNHTAAHLNMGQLWIKDESKRSKLDSFKATGAPYALIRLIQKHFPHLHPSEILKGHYQPLLQNFGVITATDGNHGRALAAAAQSAGCPCTIVLHAHVSQEREDAIAKYGANIVRVSGNYDDSVRKAKQLAESNHWTVVSDTSYPGYQSIPLDVMQGYAVLAMESIAQCPQPPTHVFLQGGVGALAAGVASYYWEKYGAHRPKLIVVEPQQADCLYQSALHAKPMPATGSVDSFMAGLACGETSTIAWEFMQNSIDFFGLITDDEAEATVKQLALGSYGDVPIVAGESGVAGLALLNSFAAQDKLKAIEIDQSSRVLIINTEGATAPSIYQQVTGMSPQQVLDKQTEWLMAN